jgi:hypothetical protein
VSGTDWSDIAQGWDYRLIPTHYAVHSRIDGDSHYLPNWVIEASED